MSGIGERLAEVRRASGLGVRGFASAIASATGYQVSHTSVANYESGTTVPAAYGVAVCRTFGANISWLLTGEGLPSRVDTPELENAFRRIAVIVRDAMPAMGSVEAEHDAFFQMSPDPFFILTEDGVLAKANPAWESVLGRRVRDLEQTRLVDLVHPDERHVVERLVSGDDVRRRARRELRFLAADGEWRVLSVRAARGHGVVYGVARDETDVRRAERALEAWRRLLEGVFERAADAMVLVNNEGSYIAVNPAACSLFGRTREELLSMTVFDVTPAQSRRSAEQLWREFLQSGMQVGTFGIERSDGRIVTVEYRAVANIEPGTHLSILHEVETTHVGHDA